MKTQQIEFYVVNSRDWIVEKISGEALCLDIPARLVVHKAIDGSGLWRVSDYDTGCSIGWSDTNKSLVISNAVAMVRTAIAKDEYAKAQAEAIERFGSSRGLRHALKKQ